MKEKKKKKEEPEPNIDLKFDSAALVGDENDKKDNENPEIQEITISGVKLFNIYFLII